MNVEHRILYSANLKIILNNKQYVRYVSESTIRNSRCSTFNLLTVEVPDFWCKVFERKSRIMNKNKSKAPNATIMFSDGTEKRLRDLWQSQTLVLVFLRHFG